MWSKPNLEKILDFQCEHSVLLWLEPKQKRSSKQSVVIFIWSPLLMLHRLTNQLIVHAIPRLNVQFQVGSYTVLGVEH